MDYSIFNELLEGVQVISEDLRYIFLNNSVKQQAGISGLDVTGKKCEEIFPGIEQSNAFIKIKECLKTGDATTFLNRFEFPNGRIGHYELRMNRINDGVIVFSVDKSSEIEKEQEIIRANERYETITNSVHSALFEWDVTGKIVFGNTIFNDLCTVNLGHPCLTLDDVLKLGDPKQQDDFKAVLQKAVKSGKPSFSYYLECRHPENDRLVSYQFNIVICYGSKGDVNNFLGYILDASEDRKIQKLSELKNRFNDIFISDRTLDDCLNEVLENIVFFSSYFRIAECWLPNYDLSKIRRRAVYSKIGAHKDPFLKEGPVYIEYERNEGLPGVCMDTNQITWWNSLHDNELFRRKELLLKSKLDTGVAIPLQIHGQITAVITLFSEGKINPDMGSVNELISLSESIGHGIALKRIAHQRDLLNDSSAILLFSTTPEGDFMRINPLANMVFRSGEFKWRNNLFDLIVNEEEKKRLGADWTDLVSGKNPLLSTNMNVLKANGRDGTLKINATTCADDDSVYIVALDISKEKEILDLLYLSNKMASIGFWSIDLINNETILSPIAKKILNIDDDLQINDLQLEFMKALMPSTLHSGMVRKLLRDTADVDLKWSKSLNNEEQQFRLIAHSEFKNGKGIRISGVIQNITAIVRTETALQTARNNYMDLIDLSPIPIWLYDPSNFKIELVNRKACELYGYTKDEFMNMHLDEILIGKEQIKALYAKEKELKGGASIYLGNFRHITRDAEALLMDNYVQLIDFVDQKLILVIGVDRTESIHQQQEISKAVIKAQETQKEEISRELHDNICQLMVASQLYLNMLQDDTAAKKENYLGEAMKLLDKANKETRDLSHALSSEKYLNQAFSQSISDLVNTYRSTSKIEIKTTFSDDFLSTLNDKDLKMNFIRIIQEAISNAIKHGEPSMVSLEGEIKNDHLQLVIKDNGKGFDPSFVQPGIGIYNMKSRIQILQGDLHISSKPNFGTTLEIQIPLVMV